MKNRSWTIRISLMTLLLISFLYQGLQAQSRRDLLVDGDFFYEMQNYPEATDNYFRASQEKSDFQSLFNLAVSQEKQIDPGDGQTAQQAMEEPEADPNATAALENYQTSMNYAIDDTQRSLAFYNMGNTLMIDKASLSMEKMEQAIEYFKSAIRFDKNNDPARHNLTIAQVMLDRAKQQEQQQQQQQEGQEQSEDQEKSEDQEQQKEQEQQESQEDQEKKEQDQKESKEDTRSKEEKEAEMKKQKQEVDKSEIENILKMVEKEDKEVQAKMRKQSKSDKKAKKKEW